jgi:hypothetical protein
MELKTMIKEGQLFSVPLNAGTKIYMGNLVILSSGYATGGAINGTMTVVGIADESVDNTGGAQSLKSVLVRRNECYCLPNDTTAPVTQALVGKMCYAKNQTTLTADSTAPAVGKVLEVNSDGIWVYIS